MQFNEPITLLSTRDESYHEYSHPTMNINTWQCTLCIVQSTDTHFMAMHPSTDTTQQVQVAVRHRSVIVFQGILKFEGLTELDLSDNDILFLPQTLGNFRQLKVLNLSYNSEYSCVNNDYAVAFYEYMHIPLILFPMYCVYMWAL